MNNALKLLIIGVDGASYELISELIQKGRLPVMSKLAMKGIFGELSTAFPPHTAPGWSSIFTGVNPGEHGIYQFWSLQTPNYRPEITTVADFGWEPLWLTLERYQLSVGVCNVPMSHPPQPLDRGYMITWPLTPTINYVLPREIIHDLAKHGLHYQSDLVTMYQDGADYINKAIEYVKNRTQTILYLMEERPVNVLIAVYTELDRVSHYYWKDSRTAGPEVERMYEAMDLAIGALIDAIQDHVSVVIVSDHGFGHCSANIQINAALRDAGLLNTIQHKEERQQSGNLAPLFFEDFAVGNANWFVSPERTRTVNWDRTRAYMPAPGCFGINLNLRNRQCHGIVSGTKEIRALETSLRSCVESLRQEDGEQLFDLLPRREVYKGHRLLEAPDYLLIPRRWDLMLHPGLTTGIWESPTQSGIHRMDGIFFAHGPGFPAANVSARVEDVTPTILAHLGLPIPDGVTGQVLGENNKSTEWGPALRIARGDRKMQSAKDIALMEKHLAALGYL